MLKDQKVVLMFLQILKQTDSSLGMQRFRQIERWLELHIVFSATTLKQLKNNKRKQQHSI